MSNAEQQWPALEYLKRNQNNKVEQRRVLRMHRESGFNSANDRDAMALRDRLDGELQIIMLRELAAQAQAEPRENYSDISQFGELIKTSPAFAQYLNYYYYFGVRFAAGRISKPWDPGAASKENLATPDSGDCNEPIIALPPPPLCPHLSHTSRDFIRFAIETESAEMLDPEIGAALRFLDDFVEDKDRRKKSEVTTQQNGVDDRPEHLKFELWLRGLYGGHTEEPFEKLARGILKWADTRCQFYMRLEEVGSKRGPLTKWRDSPWKEGRFNVNNPMAARCALVDFYWLARILRADVSPRGLVAYQGHSWLYLLAMRRQTAATTDKKRVATLAREPHRTFTLNRDNLRELLDAIPAKGPVGEETAKRVIQVLFPDTDRFSDKEVRHWAKLLGVIQAYPGNQGHVIDARMQAQMLDPRRFDGLRIVKAEILRMEEVLRAVFAYACDLIQNAVERAEECEEHIKNPLDYPERVPETKSWRTVYDAELQEMGEQRRQWRNDDGYSADIDRCTICKETSGTVGWSRRIWTGEDVPNLVGVAFSGGGIRSATFNLGVLQHLQQLDLLRHVDYLSTVSGGGYIGAWLIGNVRRTRYWLSRLTSWDKSIEHLRRYSSYLSPENGLLRADTWTMWTTWIRNAFLIQLTAFGWLAFFLVSVLAIENIFWWISTTALGSITAERGLIACLVALALILPFYLGQLDKRSAPPGDGWIDKVRVRALNQGSRFAKIGAGIAWIGAFATAALLWNQANDSRTNPQEYSWLLAHAWEPWDHWPLMVFIAAIWLLAIVCFHSKSRAPTAVRALWSLIIALATAVVSYLALCGVVRLYGALLGYPGQAIWYAFVFGPPAALAGIALAIAIYIGLLGRDSKDWSREWWTRYGAWIAMLGAAALALSLGAVFAPFWVSKFTSLPWKTVKVGAIAGWLGSVVSGLLAGKSSRTGKGTNSSPALEWTARIGGLLFIVGAIALASMLVHVLLSEIVLGDFDFGWYWSELTNLSDPNSVHYWKFWLVLCALVVLSLLFSNRFDLNIFSLNQFYRNRLVRCYLGATRWQPGKRHPNRFTAFDMDDDVELTCLTTIHNSSCESSFCGESFRGPFPIINCTLNLGGSSDLAVHTRQSAPFMLTPLYCGSPRWKVGYVRTGDYAGRVSLGQAISVSGAAASPNMGYNTSPLVSFLLTMFNVRLGWWFPNPSTDAGHGSGSLSALYLLRELFGTADERRRFVNVSDGGHFENLGIYELVRRRASVIIAADAECDSNMAFGSLGNVIRICETDFGARIDVDVASLRKDEKTGLSHAHCAVGKITYSNGSIGYLIYIKSSMTGDEEVGIAQYQAAHPSFPHETTADQFFSEDQFEAYRRLGKHITERAFRGAEIEPPQLYAIASKLFDLWVPAAFSNDAFLSNAKTFDQIWDRFRTDAKLANLFREITGEAPSAPSAPSPQPEELAACMELLQLMENVFLELRLDDFWNHPDNRGWAMLFTMCAQSAKFQEVWKLMRHTYGIRFQYFCEQHLGLGRDRPVMRL